MAQSDYVPPGPPDPPRLCRDCDTRRFDHGVIHEPECPKHPKNLTTPQQEPEGDGWEPTEADGREALKVGIKVSNGYPWWQHGTNAPEAYRAVLRWWSNRLRARVQPRRVSRIALMDVTASLAPGFEGGHEEAEEVVRYAIRRLGIEITPTEEDRES